MGCARCQQIFVVSDNAELIERVAPHYPGRQRWYWDGVQWMRTGQSLSDRYLPLALGFLVLLGLVWLPLAIYGSAGFHVLFLAVLALILAALPAVLAWITYR